MLSSKFKLELDSEPVLSRDLTLSPNHPKAAGETPAYFGKHGGSSRDNRFNKLDRPSGGSHGGRSGSDSGGGYGGRSGSGSGGSGGYKSRY